MVFKDQEVMARAIKPWQMLGGTMELLRAQNQIHVRQAINQFLTTTLSHASHKPEHHAGPVLAGLACFVFLAVLGLIALLTNPKTRDVAKVLFGVLAAVVLLVVLDARDFGRTLP